MSIADIVQQAPCYVSLRAKAQVWMEAWMVGEPLPTTGFVVFFEGCATGWMEHLDDPRKLMPGVVAVCLEKAQLFVARGGDDQAGAHFWVELILRQPECGADLIAAERRRQQASEGYSPAHDDVHTGEELVYAAVSYLLSVPVGAIAPYWPWDPASYKPGTRLEDLVKAGALIAAEIDRRQRADAGALDHSAEGSAA